MEPRGGLWKHLGSVFGHLCEILGVQVGFGLIFNIFSRSFGSQNGTKNHSGEAKNNEVASGTDLNRFLRDFGNEMNGFKSIICVLAEYVVKCMSTFQYS